MKFFFTTIWLCILGVLLTFTSEKVKSFSDEKYSILSTPPFVELDEKSIELLTLGHKGLFDDVINIWALQFLVDENITDEDVEDVFGHISKITRHQPKLESLYMISCFVLAFDFKRPDLCEKISLDGMQAFPESWRIPATQGFMAAYRLNDNVKAATFYHMASSREGAPPYMGSLAKKLMGKQNLTVEDLQNSLKLTVDIPGGSKLSDFLLQHSKNKAKQKKRND